MTRCEDCGQELREQQDGEWVAEDDTLCCADRGEDGEALPHVPVTDV
jgi:hypothetical protein